MTSNLAKHILIIEDEAPIRRFLRVALEASGYHVEEAERGRIGVEKAATSTPDLVITDLGLPDIDGKEVVRRIREWSQVPILVLSVRDGEHEKIAALDAGANDYVTKPFATGELMARLRALIRTKLALTSQTASLHVGDIVIDLAKHQVFVGKSEAKLTRKEFEVLAFLAKNEGRLVTHSQLLRTIWGEAHLKDTQYLRVAIGHIREKIGDDATNPKYINNEPGIGYRLTAAQC